MEYRIRELRRNCKMTQRELAERAGLSQTTISNLETGKLKVTPTKTILKIAQVLGVKVSEIFFK